MSQQEPRGSGGAASPGRTRPRRTPHRQGTRKEPRRSCARRREPSTPRPPPAQAAGSQSPAGHRQLTALREADGPGRSAPSRSSRYIRAPAAPAGRRGRSAPRPGPRFKELRLAQGLSPHLGPASPPWPGATPARNAHATSPLKGFRAGSLVRLPSWP